MTSHYPDLGSASDCLKKIPLARSIRSTTQIRVATLHQCGLFATFSFLRRHFAGKPLAWDQATKWGGGGGEGGKEWSETAKTNDSRWLASRVDYFFRLFRPLRSLVPG